MFFFLLFALCFLFCELNFIDVKILNQDINMRASVPSKLKLIVTFRFLEGRESYIHVLYKPLFSCDNVIAGNHPIPARSLYRNL